MNQSGLLLVLFIVVFVAGYVYLSQWDRRRRFRPLIGLLDERSGEIQAGLFSPEASLEGHFQGREVRFFFTEGSRSTRPRFHVVISCSAPIHLEITREDVAGKIGKALRLRRDIQVGDPELDSHFIFSSPWPECLAALVRMPEARRPIESILLRGGMDSLQCDSSALWSTRGVSFGMGAMKPDEVQALLQDLEGLARALETDCQQWIHENLRQRGSQGQFSPSSDYTVSWETHGEGGREVRLQTHYVDRRSALKMPYSELKRLKRKQ